MKKLSKLSQECIKNRGLCCETRTPPFFLPTEIKLLLQNKFIRNKFIFGKYSARPKATCCFFKEPLCSIYKKRPVDCRTYPVSIGLRKGEIIYVIDMRCPAVKKGLVTNRFVKQAMKIWKENIPSIEWVKEYLAEEEPRKYRWVSIEEYNVYRN